MNEEQNTRIVQDAYAAFKRGDIASVLSAMSDDVEWLLPGPKQIPLTGHKRGREQVGQFFGTLADSQEAEEFEPKELIAQGQTVVALGRYRWKVKSTGQRFESDFVHVFRVKEGRVVSFQEYFDTYEAALAWGIGKAATA